MAEIVDLNISRRAAAETFFASQHLSLGRTNSEIALREGHIGKKNSSEFHHGLDMAIRKLPLMIIRRKLTNIGEEAMFRTQMILKEAMFSTRLDIGGDV